MDSPQYLEDYSLTQEASDAIRDTLKVKMEHGVQDLHVVVVGKTGTGKTSLAGALITGESGEGRAGPKPGSTKLVHCEKRILIGIPVFIYDIRGLYDGEVPGDDIMDELEKQCPLNKIDVVIVCFRWDTRLDKSDQKVFRILHKRYTNVWKKTIFALTFCDRLPPEMKHPDNSEDVKQAWIEWKLTIQEELKKLCVPRDVVEKIQVSPTTHTKEKIDAEAFSLISPQNWLKHLWSNMIENGRNYPEVCEHVLRFAIVAFSCKNPSAFEAIQDCQIENVALALAVGVAGATGAGVGAGIAIAIAGLTVAGVTVGALVGGIVVAALTKLAIYLYKNHHHSKIKQC